MTIKTICRNTTIFDLQMDAARFCIERPASKLRFYVGLAVFGCSTVVWFLMGMADTKLWMSYPLAVIHLVALVVIAVSRPSAKVVIERDTIAWFGDGLFWPTSNLVSFIEIESVELQVSGDRQLILLHNRFSDPWVIRDNCFTDARAILAAIRELQPSLPISDREMS
ncbi:hypothetical protein-signal peptide and transmembrane prediction [Rhodopirellula baltica SH 1]|uniref:Uncharacterized protein n=2 Tax=Rhodopirellula baltica TaxID=265606 RepID=Q7UUS2_RHOBA|nr:hypothetical protein-signal peptide and transmembrane prediction [Rhodopirellula baltica SH 1]